MTDREKLVELLKQPLPEHSNDIAYWHDEHVAALADHLLANGVTIQRWIPVTERLPENTGDVIVCHKNGWVTKDAWLGSNWWLKNEANPITHWMPLPEPPKEDE